MEWYFEILMPHSKVSVADEKRDIYVHVGPLQLIDEKWNLKNWNGDLLATQYFMVTSGRKAMEEHSSCMGRYTLVRDIVMVQRENSRRTFVYKNDKGEHFLYETCTGRWCVSRTVGELNCLLAQDKGKGSSLSPSKTLPWKYGSYSNGLWMDDNTLKVFPCY